MVAFVASFGLLFALFIKSREHPTNLILLAAFTVVEAYTIGVLVTFYDVAVVVQAFFLTAGVVAGLTAFTFQTKFWLSKGAEFCVLVRTCNNGRYHLVSSVNCVFSCI